MCSLWFGTQRWWNRFFSEYWYILSKHKWPRSTSNSEKFVKCNANQILYKWRSSKFGIQSQIINCDLWWNNSCWFQIIDQGPFINCLRQTKAKFGLKYFFRFYMSLFRLRQWWRSSLIIISPFLCQPGTKV